MGITPAWSRVAKSHRRRISPAPSSIFFLLISLSFFLFLTSSSPRPSSQDPLHKCTLSVSTLCHPGQSQLHSGGAVEWRSWCHSADGTGRVCRCHRGSIKATPSIQLLQPPPPPITTGDTTLWKQDLVRWLEIQCKVCIHRQNFTNKPFRECALDPRFLVTEWLPQSMWPYHF